MTFTLYDPNMNKVDYPVGVRPLDLLVSSIEKERKEHQIDGVPGVVDYGYNYKGREVKMNFMTEHYHGTFDHRLQRDEIYNLFDEYPFLYVSDDTVPSRMLKITVDGSFTPERYGYWYSTFEVDARITGLPFWRTKYTTQEIEKDGYSAVVEKYGMADGINVDYLPYKFTTNEFTVWNGGNVTVDPRNMMLKLNLVNVTTTGNLTIENVTTGEKFIYKEAISKENLTIDGTKVLIGTSNKLRDTNRKFISLVKGVNKIKITNGTFDSVAIDSPFYFK
ncbi:phage tail domain-containing protein [Staphylococcus saprophyticus]|uniref:phage tail domain-containing protein n=1 Tax=Staphylococcus saprophyticus TaxID=29385 RepID=UPI000ADA58CB|nr:phage tail domain-containing protein [Staphylococcus saprophyticus]MDW4018965.1 phage tail family protein [Staphylococcus saprophyticus]MDW4313701.1 phage tail family protein [Staphylococcus saprophyticus]